MALDSEECLLNFGQGEILTLLQIMKAAPGTQPTFCVSVLEAPLRDKTNGLQVALLTPSTIKVKNDCTCTSNPSYAFISLTRMICYT
jgi:hypothetical protein